jgi:hypothetical protein
MRALAICNVFIAFCSTNPDESSFKRKWDRAIERSADNPLDRGIERVAFSWKCERFFPISSLGVHNQTIAPLTCTALLQVSQLSFVFFCSRSRAVIWTCARHRVSRSRGALDSGNARIIENCISDLVVGSQGVRLAFFFHPTTSV